MSKPAAGTTAYKFVGPHLDDLHDGRLLEPGQIYHLDRDAVDHPHNAQRISDGLLIEIPAAAAKERD